MKKALFVVLTLTFILASVFAFTFAFNTNIQSVAYAEAIYFQSNWKEQISSLIDATQLTKISFVSSQPSGYTLTSIVIGDVSVYKNDNCATDLAFYSDKTIYAPADSSSLFENCSNLASIVFSNFSTEYVTNATSMFAGLDIETLDLSKLSFPNLNSSYSNIFGNTDIKIIIAPLSSNATISLPDNAKYMAEKGTDLIQSIGTYSTTYSKAKYYAAYSINWQNSDGTLYSTTYAKYNTTPSYKAPENVDESEGVRSSEIIFDSWSPEIMPANENTTYTATYVEVFDELVDNWKDLLISRGIKLENVKELSFTTTLPKRYTRVSSSFDKDDEYDKESYIYFMYCEDAKTTKIGFVTNNYTILAPKKCDKLFEEFTNLEYLDLSAFDMSQTTSANNMISSTQIKTLILPCNVNINIQLPCAYYLQSADTYDNNAISSDLQSSIQDGKIKETTLLKQYNISWVVDNIKIFSCSTSNQNTCYSNSPENPTKDSDGQYDYIFQNWEEEYDGTANIVFNAVFTKIIRMYEVKFVNYDGSLLQSTQYEYGEIPVYSGVMPERNDLSKYKCSFAGWDNEIVKVTGDATYTAVFKKTPITVVDEKEKLPTWAWVVIAIFSVFAVSLAITFAAVKLKNKLDKKYYAKHYVQKNAFSSVRLYVEQQTRDVRANAERNEAEKAKRDAEDKAKEEEAKAKAKEKAKASENDAKAKNNDKQ